MTPKAPAGPEGWTFLTNYSHVLVCLASDPFMRLKEVAAHVGITERAVVRIVGELERAGAIHKEREGRRNRYTIELNLPLRHPVEAHRTIGELLAPILDRSG